MNTKTVSVKVSSELNEKLINSIAKSGLQRPEFLRNLLAIGIENYPQINFYVNQVGLLEMEIIRLKDQVKNGELQPSNHPAVISNAKNNFVKGIIVGFCVSTIVFIVAKHRFKPSFSTLGS